MATATMATAAGAAALLYYTLNRRLQIAQTTDEEQVDSSHGPNLSSPSSRSTRVSRRPALAPATWLETISTLSETLRFTYSETLGKWPIGDLAFGINFLLKRQVMSMSPSQHRLLGELFNFIQLLFFFIIQNNMMLTIYSCFCIFDNLVVNRNQVGEESMEYLKLFKNILGLQVVKCE